MRPGTASRERFQKLIKHRKKQMQIFGVLVSMGMFVFYFCLKYTYTLRSNAYSRQPSIREVWSFSFDGHPQRRSVVPIKYIAIFFAFTGLFGWNSPISQDDINKLWQFPAILVIYLNIWARTMIYESTHWKEKIEKSMPGPAGLSILRRSIKEIGWFPVGDNWLSTMIVGTNILFLAVCVVRLTVFIL